MRVSDELYEMHVAFEGKRYEPYLDTGGVLTIGVGHTADAAFPFNENTVWTEETVRQAWVHDVQEAETLANRWLNRDVDQNWFDVSVDLIFNCGRPKTYLARINEGDLSDARVQILRWIYDNKKVYLGLVKRRFANYAMSLGQDWRPFANCNATSRNIKPLNELIEPYGYELVHNHHTNFLLVRNS